MVPGHIATRPPTNMRLTASSVWSNLQLRFVLRMGLRGRWRMRPAGHGSHTRIGHQEFHRGIGPHR